MAFEDQCIHRVDVYSVDDTATGARGGLKPVETHVYSNRICLVTDIRSATYPRHGREQMETTHLIKFPAPLKLDSTHLIRWTDPDDSAVRTMMVTGMIRPKSPNMPWIVNATEYVT